MSFLLNYFKNSYIELKKVVWPDRQEVTKIALPLSHLQSFLLY